MKEFDLMKSEIKKAERFAAKESGVTCFLAAWGYDGVDDLGWADVLCEMDGTNQVTKKLKITGAFGNPNVRPGCLIPTLLDLGDP